MSQRHYSFIDKICISIDQTLRALSHNAHTTARPYPAVAEDLIMNNKQKQHAAGLMRVNHTGEICAQALYHGQYLGTKNTLLQAELQRAAVEEGDHLAWCKQRLDELGSHASYLIPLVYAGSFCLGLAAGMIGDEWSLGFIAETEDQVIRHLQNHIDKLPVNDLRSREILQKMAVDETSHKSYALAAGGEELPELVKSAMAATAKIMVKTTYWL